MEEIDILIEEIISSIRYNKEIIFNLNLKREKMLKNKKELAKNFNVTVRTLSNWEKEKPELIKIINLGILTCEFKDDLDSLVSKLREIERNSEGKLITK